MSTTADACPHSRRFLLTAGLAGSVAATGTLGAHVALGAVAGPDPVFALIEAERMAWVAFEAASAASDAAETAFGTPADSRRPSVQISVGVLLVEHPGDPSRPVERRETPNFSHDRNDIIASFKSREGGTPWFMEANGRRATSSVEPCCTLEEALADFDAQAANIEEAQPSPEIAEAERRWEVADEAARVALDAVIACRPTTRAGLIAMLDLVDERRDAIDDHSLVLDAVRAFLVGREA